MTSRYQDFTICWVPPANDPLTRFGALWTGWCPETAEHHPRLRSPNSGLDWRRMTEGVSRRGLHGIFHGPFQLKDQDSIWKLEQALRTLADGTRAMTIRNLEIAVVGRRVGLVPGVRSRALDDLCERIRHLAADFEARPESPDCACDDGKAVIRAASKARVKVVPSHAFHLPLTDPLQEPSACHIAMRLRPMVQHVLGGSHTIGEIALLAGPGGNLRARVRDHYTVFDGTGRAGSTLACCGPRLYAPLTLSEQTAEVV